MAVHIEEMTSEVTVVAGELPLSPAQIEKLVQLVCRRLQEMEREAKIGREATTIRQQARSPLPIQ
ncbi:MAG: hypothetical protein R6X18_17285 [Chloroflexota bacterium]